MRVEVTESRDSTGFETFASRTGESYSPLCTTCSLGDLGLGFGCGVGLELGVKLEGLDWGLNWGWGWG